MFPRNNLSELLAVKPEEWAKELAGQEEFFATLAPYVPEELLAEQKKVARAARSLGRHHQTGRAAARPSGGAFFRTSGPSRGRVRFIAP